MHRITEEMIPFDNARSRLSSAKVYKGVWTKNVAIVVQTEQYVQIPKLSQKLH